MGRHQPQSAESNFPSRAYFAFFTASFNALAA
jgi:hypothetical protein